MAEVNRDLVNFFKRNPTTVDLALQSLYTAAMEMTEGHAAQAAELIGISTKTMYNWRDRYERMPDWKDRYKKTPNPTENAGPNVGTENTGTTP